ncbi:carbohydrate ABC transporter permease [Anaerocolumna sp. MB42-C2]|uniref:carbohydrate ABC transporter permease n=1 Tax=Anaerocolumna sp. MB42-C2 TaxID=3070997 RepID=UPI0027E216FF|nr:carbohydrate ABC transporter permease [Anaerocolumna sp. MB42-C2]WMJ90272.1 carbohydrate ABC transporter permease [Anaerocolumna sp. MB42-C2]
MNKKILLRKLFANTIMTMLVLPIIFMIAWYILSSTYNYSSGEISFQNFSFLYTDINFQGIYLPMIWPIVLNTLVYSLIIVIVEVTVAVPAAYAFSRLEFRGRKAAMKFLFIMRAFPGITLIIATFLIILKLRIINTYLGVVLVAVSGSLPGQIYIMKGFFDEVPWDLEWASMVDGTTRWRAFKKVLLPAVSSGIGAIAVFAFLGAYGEWFLFRLFIFDDTALTMGGYLAKLVSKENSILSYGFITAIGLFYTLPVIIFYILSQKIFMRINIGGTKRV